MMYSTDIVGVQFTWFDVACKIPVNFVKSDLKYISVKHYYQHSIRSAPFHAGKGVVKREPSCSVGGNVN